MPRTLATLALAIASSAVLAETPQAGHAPTFEGTVVPVLAGSCTACHSTKGAAGGLDIAHFLHPSSLRDTRDEWEVILKKLRSGQMPPKGSPRPPQSQVDGLIAYIEGELDRAN